MCHAYYGEGYVHLNQPEKAYSFGKTVSIVVLVGSELTCLSIYESMILVVESGTFPPLSGDGLSLKNFLWLSTESMKAPTDVE